LFSGDPRVVRRPAWCTAQNKIGAGKVKNRLCSAAPSHGRNHGGVPGRARTPQRARAAPSVGRPAGFVRGGDRRRLVAADGRSLRSSASQGTAPACSGGAGSSARVSLVAAAEPNTVARGFRSTAGQKEPPSWASSFLSLSGASSAGLPAS
jgi:hypothetical protein